MPILLAAAFWLIVTVHGEVKHQAGPLTGADCLEQMAYWIVRAHQMAASGVPVVVDGRVVTLGDVVIECRPGERGT